MRFSTAIAAFGLVALVSAQTSVNVTSTSEAAPSTTADQSPTARCLSACADTDLCCQASCVGVPCPNDLQANQTTECASQCVQGDGSEEETASYAACQQSCISSLFFPLSTTAGGAGATGTAGGSTDATATADGSGIGVSSDGSPSETGAAASASTTGDSDNGAVRNSIAGAGLLGLVVAGLAL